MIHDHAIAFAEAAASGAGLHDLPARLVPGDHSLVAFRPLAQMLVINAADIRAADGGGLHAQQHFAVSGLRNRHLPHLHRAIAGQDTRRVIDALIISVQVPEIFPCLVLLSKKYLPFDQAAVAVDAGDRGISSAVSGSLTAPWRLAR